MSGLKVIFGGGMIGSGRGFKNKDDLEALFAVLKQYDVRTIDTAQLYGDSEELLGSVNAGSQFIIDTKWKGGFAPGSPTQEDIVKTAEESMQRLNMDKVDIFYIHAPDSSVPLSSTLAGVNEVYKKGYFTRFGLSNYQAKDVEAVYNHCKENGYVLPSVYQGNYSAVARKQDTLLFPTLRKLNIAFYAYSPLAGGFLTKTKEQIAGGAGRFGDMLGGMYKSMYAKPAYLEALSEWETIAKDTGCSKGDLAYRWVTYNSPLKPEQGDGVIVGASSLKQLEQTLEGLKAGPLPEEAVKKIDQIWTKIEHEAPLDNYHR